MGRFGRLPVQIPDGVKVEAQDGKISIAGPKGTVIKNLHPMVSVKIEGNQASVATKGESQFENAIKGTMKSHITNMVKGVTDGWSKSLELVGTGYRAEVKGADLYLTLGYSHPIIVKAPEGVKFSVDKLKVTVEGVDKDEVGQVAARIRAARKPDPYKGKGVKYENEILRKKPGKQAAKTGA